MGSAVSSISSGLNSVRDTVNNATGTRLGDAVPYLVGGPTGGSAYYAMGLDKRAPDAPEAPGINDNLSRLRAKQMEQAKQFREGLPGMKNKMASDLRVEGNQAMSAQSKNINESNSRRGLLYGGINAGQQGAARGAAQGRLAKAISANNVNLESAADTMDAQAIDTGVGIQQSQQAIQNQLYSQAQARLNGENQITGSILGAGLGMATAGMSKG